MRRALALGLAVVVLLAPAAARATQPLVAAHAHTLGVAGFSKSGNLPPQSVSVARPLQPALVQVFIDSHFESVIPLDEIIPVSASVRPGPGLRAPPALFIL